MAITKNCHQLKISSITTVVSKLLMIQKSWSPSLSSQWTRISPTFFLYHTSLPFTFLSNARFPRRSPRMFANTIWDVQLFKYFIVGVLNSRSLKVGYYEQKFLEIVLPLLWIHCEQVTSASWRSRIQHQQSTELNHLYLCLLLYIFLIWLVVLGGLASFWLHSKI